LLGRKEVGSNPMSSLGRLSLVIATD
jgi:hypothetical protein